jgi:hypothetical protein
MTTATGSAILQRSATCTEASATSDLAAGNFDQAIRCFEELESLGQSSAVTSYNRGLAYLGRKAPGDRGQAKVALAQVNAHMAEQQSGIDQELLVRRDRAWSSLPQEDASFYTFCADHHRGALMVGLALAGFGLILAIAARKAVNKASGRTFAVICLLLGAIVCELSFYGHSLNLGAAYIVRTSTESLDPSGLDEQGKAMSELRAPRAEASVNANADKKLGTKTAQRTNQTQTLLEGDRVFIQERRGKIVQAKSRLGTVWLPSDDVRGVH